ncbi:unnamed protein product [Rotaria sp. Silwood1]|nr:unnamed protein product [Rotaria sp. Silwood1]CAF3615985.1 unnamed protein product [Rotaria sp. Silwood1]CAF3618038.1 unnamed protein product [Rotaria sp. Silwood1]CAF4905284.1 unnamed protein product [Rotaria sp. Silwood1]CAF4943963.1 unnamed protein product [Rotaria sp. Silwood1]
MPIEPCFINSTNNKKFRLNGILRSTRLPDKHKLCQKFRQDMVLRTDQLPPNVDLRSDMTPVEDQSQLGSCVANCLAGAYEYLAKKSNGINIDVSRLFIYYNARVKGNYSESIEDTGCSMTDAIEALEELGTCLESIWPYDISNVNTRPSDQAFQQAKKYTINEAFRVDLVLNEMKSCLAQGFPFGFGIQLFNSFDNARKTGVVPMPDPSESSRESHGSHAMLAVGYNDQSRAFIVRNSWGEEWGDRGYCYVPYDYMTNSDFCFDAWTIRKLMNNDFSQENWHFDDNKNNYSDDIHDNNHFIEKLDGHDDTEGYNGNQDLWWNDKNREGDNYDFSYQYQTDETNNYSTNDANYYDNASQNNQDIYLKQDWNSDTNYSYPQNAQYDNQTNYCDDVSNFN